MTSNRNVDLSPEARRDMRDIARYTTREWGEAQAERYVEQLAEAFARIGRYPEIGVRREEIDQGLRSLPVQNHVVYYEILSDAVLVLRVFHQRMDVARAFAEN